MEGTAIFEARPGLSQRLARRLRTHRPITAGAVVLCFGSPLTAWLTSRFDRRLLLAATLLVLAAGHLASAFAPDYFTLLAIRVSMLAVGALYTPQANTTIVMRMLRSDQ